MTEPECPDRDPDGLLIFQNFISEQEEKEFIELFDWVEECNREDHNLKNRSVKHYGFRFRYGNNDVDRDSPLEETIPAQCDMLWTRLKQHGVEFETPDQLTVNKYEPGQGIPAHVDRHSPFGKTIMSLSLVSSVVMDWRHHSGLHVPVLVPRRSLLVMQGAARYDWQHGIQPRTWDPVIAVRAGPRPARVTTFDRAPRGPRLSLTFRTTRAGACDCAFRSLCDVGAAPDLDDGVAAELEELHVHQVYEQIAAHFSSTRHSVWPQVAAFVRAAPPGAVLLDLGAGNGKNLPLRPDLLQVACERSGGLAAECARRVRAGGADVVRLDVLRAPLRDACADLVLSIAVVHHFSSPARRREAIATIARLLRPGGRALITVWAREQAASRYLSGEREREGGGGGGGGVVRTGAGVALPVHVNRTQFRHGDVLVPWSQRGRAEPLLRYYHVFERGELERLCAAPGLLIETSFYDEGNWCVVCRKI